MPYDLSIVGWFTEAQLQVIEKIAQTVPEHGVVVEIGSMYGRSTICWAKTCPPSSTIYAIDIFPETKIDIHNFSDTDISLHNFPKSGYTYNQSKLFDQNLKSYTNVKKITGISPFNINYPGNNIDILFLDAAHVNPNDWENIKYFLPFVNQGGIICGHDYSEEFPDILKNVKALEEILGTDAEINHQIWQIKVTKKITFNE